MIDTIRIMSPYISKDAELAVYRLCKMHRLLVNTETGQIEWEFFSGEIRDSWDSRISLRIVDEEVFRQNGVPMKRKSVHARLCVECSIHKAMLGHNVFGGPERIKPAVRWLIDELEIAMNCDLPDSMEWELQRIDWAEIFQYSAVRAWFKCLKHLYYPRRGESAIKWEDTSFWVSTSMVYVKCYQKGPEFMQHDYKKIVQCKGVPMAELLKQVSNNMLRFEVEIRSRKLKQIHKVEHRDVLIKEVNDELLKEVWVSEMGKILQFEMNVTEIYCDTYAVHKRLQVTDMTKRKQLALMGTWQMFSTLGEEHCKEMIPKSTLMRHKLELKKLGISWSSTDSMLIKEDVIAWVPKLGCDEHIGGEAREISVLLDICENAM